MASPRQNRYNEKRSKVKLSKLTFHKLDWLEYITVGLEFWFIIYPKPYEILFTTLLAIPIVGLVLNGLAGRPSTASLVEISKDEEGSEYFDVVDFIDLATLVILGRVLFDFEFDNFNESYLIQLILIKIYLAFVLKNYFF